ncbi:prolipoprotein diacylglyceryl transferase [Sedimenticola selenatireducens]|uniref:Phosphatidylglycerol--prolipoprotein diacylglyceryl transferase n=1 Tax=Sedimenticola selenatireducens TaxID=191960 RepID=A0A558DQE6_9GAMM|nr:prolipoprotein diacylglyceryl transferase [Sedimenticola selenatireducens]TVO73008.1 prolipoprotein diacylglyceryl transferase [Sedimenticola selenatireducens]TVT63232.1 MAG: prolipoprotein diacylglyceryl transferase [Sedimenticola selenatireducens]
MPIYPNIDPVALSVGPISIHWYGIMYMVAFIGGWWLGRVRAARPDSGWKADDIDDLLFYMALGIILGGRIGYTLFYGFDNLIRDPLSLFRVWEGGMSFHGGLLGVMVALMLFAKRFNRTFFECTDFVAPLIPLGLGAGRIGNFINGELWGGPTSLPWGFQINCKDFPSVCFDTLNLAEGTLMSQALHPNQLYEALLEGILLFIILWLYSSRPRPAMAVSGLFLTGYGVIRFIIEFVRLPDAHIGYLAFDWFTMGQLLSAPMIFGGLTLILLSYMRRNAVSCRE